MKKTFFFLVIFNSTALAFYILSWATQRNSQHKYFFSFSTLQGVHQPVIEHLEVFEPHKTFITYWIAVCTLSFCHLGSEITADMQITQRSSSVLLTQLYQAFQSSLWSNSVTWCRDPKQPSNCESNLKSQQKNNYLESTITSQPPGQLF